MGKRQQRVQMNDPNLAYSTDWIWDIEDSIMIKTCRNHDSWLMSQWNKLWAANIFVHAETLNRHLKFSMVLYSTLHLHIQVWSRRHICASDISNSHNIMITSDALNALVLNWTNHKFFLNLSHYFKATMKRSGNILFVFFSNMTPVQWTCVQFLNRKL